MSYTDILLAKKLSGGGGGGGGDNHIETINGTLDTIVSQMSLSKFTEFRDAMQSNNASATIWIDFSSLMGSGSAMTFPWNWLSSCYVEFDNSATPYQGYSLEFRSIEGTTADICIYRAVMIMSGNAMDITQYAENMATKLTIYWHTMPTTT